MEELWQRLCAALADLSPTLPARLRPGVDEALLHLAELLLPEEAQCYGSCHTFSSEKHR